MSSPPFSPGTFSVIISASVCQSLSCASGGAPPSSSSLFGACSIVPQSASLPPGGVSLPPLGALLFCVSRYWSPRPAGPRAPRSFLRSPPLALWVAPRLQPFPPTGFESVAFVWAAAASQPKPPSPAPPLARRGDAPPGSSPGSPSGSALRRPLSSCVRLGAPAARSFALVAEFVVFLGFFVRRVIGRAPSSVVGRCRFCAARGGLLRCGDTSPHTQKRPPSRVIWLFARQSTLRPRSALNSCRCPRTREAFPARPAALQTGKWRVNCSNYRVFATMSS